MILSTTFNKLIEHSVMAMITSAMHTPWPLDVAIADLDQAGLSAKSVIRMKLFTLDHRLIIRKIGELSIRDQKELNKALRKGLPL